MKQALISELLGLLVRLTGARMAQEAHDRAQPAWRLRQLDRMRARLAGIDVSSISEDRQRAIQHRVLRSEQHIAHITREFLQSGFERIDHVRIELVEALWWEIRAIRLLPHPKRKGAISENQRIIRALLTENPDGGANTLWFAYSKKPRKTNARKLKRDSFDAAVSKARRAFGKKRVTT